MTVLIASPLPSSAFARLRHDRATSRRVAFGNLSLAYKVGLIPAIILLLMGLMLTVAMRMGERNTAALRALDSDVFEPLTRAQTLKDEITLLHNRLFALLSIGNNEANPVAQKASADAIATSADTAAVNFNRFLASSPAVSPHLAAALHKDFDAYLNRVRDTASFAAYDSSYGALFTSVTNDQFKRLRRELDSLVQSLAQRRTTLATEAVGNSLSAQKILLGLGLGVTVLTVLGSVAVGRSIALPILRLTSMMNKLADGDTDLAVPCIERRDEVGAMAHTVEVFRANLIARREGEAALRRTNVQFDAALNSMMQGMIVWGPDLRVQLVNRRFFAIVGMPEGSIMPGLTVREVIDAGVSHGLHTCDNPTDLANNVTALLRLRRSRDTEMEMRPGLFVRVVGEPMANGGAVSTYEDVTEKREREAQITFMARHDALTGLPNRLSLQEHLTAILGHGKEAQPFCVFCLDLDHFKEVNDTLGHPAGDELLRLAAGRLRHCVRDQDLVARLGGDEFAIVAVIPAGDPQMAASLASRLVETIGAPYALEGREIVVGASIGIALSGSGISAADLMKRADVALYKAKEQRGTFAFFESGMDEQLQTRLGMEADLRLALHRGEFELNYQPLFNIAQERITAFEALIRWNSPTRGRVAPADFIELAEQTGLIIPIGAWVLRTACAEAASWPDQIRVAVNLSSIQTRDQHLLALVRETLEQTGLSAQRLELEITESVLLQDTEVVMTLLQSLHAMGVRVSMDDFGTGYSSLSYLRRFPFDKIKIDRSFVSDLRGAENGCDGTIPDPLSTAANSAATIIHAIVGLGQSLGISTTAEGVETAQQFAQIRQNGCTEVQGYFISPPRPANEVADLLRCRNKTLPAIATSPGASPQLVA